MIDCDLLIENCCVLLPDFTLLENASLAIQKNCLTAIGPAGEIREKVLSANKLDASGKIAMPGFVDAHTHTAQQLLRGWMNEGSPAPYPGRAADTCQSEFASQDNHR